MATLSVIVYHYVRDLARTPFPRIKGLTTDRFRRQIDGLGRRFEMATMSSALDFLRGCYRPSRDLCLLTFDDGLKDHYVDVLPVLADAGVQAVFFVATSPLAGRVAAVHKNHFLTAALGFDVFRERFIERLRTISPDTSTDVVPTEAESIYRLDVPAVACFKFLLNFRLDQSLRDAVIDALFSETFDDEAAFAAGLYLNWTEVRAIQASGMLIGGHSHEPRPLSRLTNDRLRHDVTTCAQVLRAQALPQSIWPFSYPYGDFNACTSTMVREAGFDCSFTLEIGPNEPAQDVFRIKRLDTMDLPLDI